MCLFVLYGSVTGNAEAIAKDLAAKSPPAPFAKIVCKPMEKYKEILPDLEREPRPGLRRHGVVLISSTTGNGDAPENASRFVRYLRRQAKAESQPFRYCAYAVLGLGDTNYDRFCATAKLLDRQMEVLGGERVQPLRCADEGTGNLEAVVEPWAGSILNEMGAGCVSSCKKPSSLPVDRPLFIMYGSQTGNCEEIAKTLANSCRVTIGSRRTSFTSVICCELNQFKKSCLPYWLHEGEDNSSCNILVICSTTGNGEAPENATRFLRYLKRSAVNRETPLARCCFSVLALGDSNYDQYCQAGKDIDRLMQVNGGRRVNKLFCADEGTGMLEPTVQSWTKIVLGQIHAERLAPESGVLTQHGSLVDVDVDVDVNGPAGENARPWPSSKSDAMALASTGVRVSRLLLSVSPDEALPNVDSSSLPALPASRSSCELLDENHALTRHGKNQLGSHPGETATVSSSTSATWQFTFSKPFYSKLRGARYLTETKHSAAEKICSSFASDQIDFVAARRIIEESFPFDGVDSLEAERNGKRVLEIELSIPDDFSMEYLPGDSIGIVVPNPEGSCRFVLNNLLRFHGISDSQMVSIVDFGVMSVRDLIQYRLDLSSPIKSSREIYALSQVASNGDERKILEIMASDSETGRSLLRDLVLVQRLTIVDILELFPSCQVLALNDLLALLPVLPPRYYSIASSPFDLQGSRLGFVKIALSVVDYLTESLILGGREFGKRRVHGVATSFLEVVASFFLCSKGDLCHPGLPALRIFPKPSKTFRPPSSNHHPMVLIGPGTGIAPFVGFLAHRRMVDITTGGGDHDTSEGTWRGDFRVATNRLEYRGSKQTAGEVDVYFGCRRCDHDFIYKKELLELIADGTASRLFTAFSREADVLAASERSPRYVQDIMRDNQEAKSRLLQFLADEKTIFFVCGDKTMSVEVMDALGAIICSEEARSTGLQTSIEELKLAGRLRLDVW